MCTWDGVLPSVHTHGTLGQSLSFPTCSAWSLPSVGAHESSSVWSERPGAEVQSCPWQEDSRGGCAQAGLNPTYLAAAAGRRAPALSDQARGARLGLANAETLTSRRETRGRPPEDHRGSKRRGFSTNS